MNNKLKNYAINGDINNVKLLLHNGAIIDEDIITWTAYYGKFDILKLLLKNNGNKYINEALKISAQEGFIDIAYYLLQNGADIHASKDNPLLRAICRKNIDMVKFLIDNGANSDNIENLESIYDYTTPEILHLILNRSRL